MTLAEAIRKLADKGDEVYAKVCKVKSIDEGKHTCDVEPLDESADILGVRLQASPDMDSGLLVVPVVGSFVVVNFLNKNAAVLALCSEVDYIQLRGEDLGGLIKVEELVKQVNKIEDDINALKNVFSGWVTAPQDGGAALKASATTWFGSALKKTTKSQIENDKVKHG